MAILTGIPSNPYWKIPTKPWRSQPDSNMPVPWVGYPHDDQATMMAPYREDLSLGAKRNSWRCLWSHGPITLVCHLRLKFKLNLKAYLRSYTASDEDLMRDVETSFGYFVKLEARLLRRSRQFALSQDGEVAVKEFMEAISSDGILTEEADFVFVSIDFEGQYGQKTGIKEFGIATLDTRSCFGPLGRTGPASKDVIECFSYARTRSASRQFQYGTTTKMDANLLTELISSSVMIIDHLERTGPVRFRKVMLVGQSIIGELYNIEQLGLDIRELGVVGTIDTWDLAQSSFGVSLRLKQIMDRLEMPQRENSYHTAGNDAYFALQAMLAMLVRRYRKDAPCVERLDWLDQMARRVEGRPQYMDKTAEGDWEDCLNAEGLDIFRED